MYDNPLIPSILSLLRATPDGVSEHGLIKQLQQTGLLAEKEPAGNLGLFQKHFLVMNALYQLRDRLLQEEGVVLHIDPLSIRLTSCGEEDRGDSSTPSQDEPLRRYYLEWDNLARTSEADVAALLQGFWSRFHAFDQRAEALQQLGLALDEVPSWSTIQRNYRQLIAQHHPDKGGEPARFIRIREAYELLQRLYARA